MKLSLPNELFSHQDLRSVIAEIKAYNQLQDQNAVKKRFKGAVSKETELSPVAADLINQISGSQSAGPKELDKLVNAMEDFADTAPRMSITLAAAPPMALKKDLVTWCRKNISPIILVDFKFNSLMLGGMMVHYGSHVYDWSFRRQIMESLDRFPEALRNV